MSFVTNPGSFGLATQLPLNKGQFYAAASLTTQTTPQYVPVSALATTTANTGGGILVTNGGTGQSTIAGFRVSFTGDAANVGGQTATIQIYKNGVAITTAVTSALATTAGTKTASVDLTSAPIALADGDLIQAAVIIGVAGLTAVLTNVHVALG